MLSSSSSAAAAAAAAGHKADDVTIYTGRQAACCTGTLARAQRTPTIRPAGRVACDTTERTGQLALTIDKLRVYLCFCASDLSASNVGSDAK